MSADRNQAMVSERAGKDRGSASGAVEKRGRGFDPKDEADKEDTDGRLVSASSASSRIPAQAGGGRRAERARPQQEESRQRKAKAKAKPQQDQEVDFRVIPDEDEYPALGSTPQPEKQKDRRKGVHGVKKEAERRKPAKHHQSEDGKQPDRKRPAKHREVPELMSVDDLKGMFGPRADSVQTPRAETPNPLTEQRNEIKYNDDRRERAPRSKPDEHRLPASPGPDGVDGDNRSSGGHLKRPPRQHHSNEKTNTDRRRSRTEKVAPEDYQPPSGMATGGQGPRPDERSDQRLLRTLVGPTSEGGGVSLVYNEFFPQSTVHYQARDESGAERRGGAMSNQRGQRPPDSRPSKPQQPPDPPLDTNIVELETTIREKDEQISELKETISRLHQRDGDPTKADSHFAAGFSNIACAIEQWVLPYCPRGQTDPDAGSRPVELQELLRMASCEPEKHFGSHRVHMLSAVVVQLLSRRVFSSLFPGELETAQALQVLKSKLALQGTFYQCQRWRALTMNVLAKGDGFEGNLAAYVDRVTEEFTHLLSILSPMGSDNVRRKNGLRDIVEQGAKLAVEIHKQPDLIFLKQVKPGSPYSAECMEDMSCLYNESDLEKGAATVQIQTFPTVLRRSCEFDGGRPAVVMKAKVMAELPSQGEVLVE